ncbi:hypothetical protein BDZ89DRAFT_1088428 [Hymenopellis radicata]|nr:hypothetical protein BDZ89DRAFT_1088428 [Hymenopellis radicata]
MNITSGRASRQRTRVPWSRERLVHERAIALGLAIDASSSGTYDSGLNSYLAFCNIHHMPVTPTPDTLSFFTVYMSAHINPRSVGTYLSGVCNKLEPYFPEVRANRASHLVKRSLAGCLKRDSSHDDILFVAMLCTGFCGLLRLGELSVPDNKKIRDYRKCSTRASVSWDDSGYGFELPYHKADRFFEGNKIKIIRRGGATAMAEDGCAPHLIQAAGRWASDTFQIYIRKNPVVLQAMLFHGRDDD